MNISYNTLKNVHLLKKILSALLLGTQTLSAIAMFLGQRRLSYEIAPLHYYCDLVSGGITPSNWFWGLVILGIIISFFFPPLPLEQEGNNTPYSYGKVFMNIFLTFLLFGLGILGINLSLAGCEYLTPFLEPFLIIIRYFPCQFMPFFSLFFLEDGWRCFFLSLKNLLRNI